MYANANDYTVWLFLKADMGLSDFHSRSPQVWEWYRLYYQPTDKVSLAIWKVKKMEVKTTWTKLKIIWLEKIKHETNKQLF